MPISYVYYDLQDGFVHNWLVAGPQVIPVDLARFPGADFEREVARHYYEQDSGIAGLPVERGPLTEGTFRVGDYEGTWSYVRCREDHLVNHSACYPTCHYLRSWAYAQVMSKKPQPVTLVLTTYGPADVWLNGEHVQRQEHLHDRHPRSVHCQARFRKGANQILVRFEGVAVRECPHTMALRICEPVSDVRVRLPTTIEDVARRNTLEQVFEAAYLERDVFARDDQIVVRWPEDMSVSAITIARLQTPSGRIYAEAHEKGAPGDTAFLGSPYQMPDGPYRAVLMPVPREYYEGNMRIRRELSLWCLGNNSYSEAPYGTYQERRQEALANAARRQGSVFAEAARMALGRWPAVETGTILEAIARINRREDGSALDLLGLLGVVYRYGQHPQFPQALRQPLEDCILNFEYCAGFCFPSVPFPIRCYWHDEPGRDALCHTTESQRILFHTCEVLAGQLYPERVFGNSGQTGQQHRAKGERLALGWLHARGASGFEEWDSNCCFADDLAALSHLIELAQTEQVWEMAAVVMDKMLLTLALNSYKGVFGSTHGRTDASSVKGGLLEPTGGIARLMWGTGIFNHHVAGAVSLACTERYELPPIISEIATSLPEEMWNRERHTAASLEPGGREQEVNKVTYRTPNYMLCSAQDYRPGATGCQEHIWQATLGPAAVVFVTHPACACEEDVCRPNFWLGNAVLPRVAQWKDVLIAVHQLPEDDWMGFTHAYFPVYAFDEHVLRDSAGGQAWAFARKGNGYLALTAAQGLSLVRQGHSACHELRSYGQHNVWLCHMGRATLDGDFGTFQEKVLALNVTFDGLSVRCDTLRGETLSFGWAGPLLRNGREEPLAGFRHYENPYCIADLSSTQMEVRSENYLLRLSFGDP
jgi:hypothetical protein